MQSFFFFFAQRSAASAWSGGRRRRRVFARFALLLLFGSKLELTLPRAQVQVCKTACRLRLDITIFEKGLFKSNQESSNTLQATPKCE